MMENMSFSFISIFFLLTIIEDSMAVRFSYLGVPGFVIKGEPVWLDCAYDLEDDELYSVKWYKDNVEFYRYLPSDNPSAQMYKLDGVFLDLNRSNATHALLSKSELESEGTYGCEVSTEIPSFRTIKAEKTMHVYVLPPDGPIIYGVIDAYGIGSEINATCVYGPSKPPADLIWFINGEQAPASYVYEQREGFNPVPHVPPGHEGPSITGSERRYYVGDLVDVNCTSARSTEPAELQWYVNDIEVQPEFLSEYRPVVYPDGLSSTKLGLQFRVQEEHFKGEEMRLKCTATLSKTLRMTSEEKISGSHQRSSGLQIADNSESGWSQMEKIYIQWCVIISCLLSVLFS